MKIMLTRKEFNQALRLNPDLMQSAPVRSVETWTSAGVIYMSTEPLSAAKIKAGAHPVSSIALCQILTLADQLPKLQDFESSLKQEPVQKEVNQIEPD